MQTSTSVDEVLRQKFSLETPSFVAQLLPQLVELVRSSRRLPQGEEYAIRRGSKDFLVASKDLGSRSLGTAHRTLKFLDPSTHYNTKPEDLGNFNLIIDSIDNILENVDRSLKAAKEGISQQDEAEAAEGEASSSAPTLSRSSVLGGRSAAKPQVRWRQLIDNDRTMFVPRLLVKHNQRSPLPPKLVAAQRKAGLRGPPSAQEAAVESPGDKNSALHAHLEAMGVGKRPEDNALPHPYEEELNALSWPESLFQPDRAQRYGRVEDTPLVVVRTPQGLREMIQEIQATCIGKELAIDVEHHDFRSYRGFTCLVQVSTRQKDFLIDPFDIFAEMHMLNEVTSDPRILKVLHGADRDVLWLQRDFSLYIVNMFDTGLATRALKLQGGFSLANLVSHFCGVKLDKKYQTADWRERPLPPEMQYYARADTHYLLFCFDVLRNALLAQTGMASTSGVNVGLATLEAGQITATEEGVQALRGVLERSTGLCRLQHSEYPLDAGSQAMNLSERFGSKQRPLEPKQFSALQALLEWRDKLGRRLDESLNFIAPDACLWRVALAMPTTPLRLRSTCNPLPVTLQQHAQEVVDLISSSLEGKSSASAKDVEMTTKAVADTAVAPQVASTPARAATTSASSTSVMGRNAAAPAVPAVVWPTPGLSPRPLVHVSASFGKGKNGGASILSGCAADSESEEETAAALAKAGGVESADVPLSAQEKKGKMKAIRESISFATPSPVPLLSEPLTVAAASAAAAAEVLEAVQNAEPEAPAPTTLRPKKKKKRKLQATTPHLETVVERQGAAMPPVQAPAAVPAVVEINPGAAVASTASAQASSSVSAAAAAAEGPRPKKRKKGAKKSAAAVAAQETLVDPYL